jgi:hypothetical protein
VLQPELRRTVRRQTRVLPECSAPVVLQGFQRCCGRLARAESERVHYTYRDLGESLRHYHAHNAHEGLDYESDGETILIVGSSRIDDELLKTLGRTRAS